jgi:hypothetical protein
MFTVYYYLCTYALKQHEFVQLVDHYGPDPAQVALPIIDKHGGLSTDHFLILLSDSHLGCDWLRR